MPTPTREAIGYILAAAGLGCAVAAASIQGGVVAGLSAAGAGLTSLAAVWGYVSKTPAAPKQ